MGVDDAHIRRGLPRVPGGPAWPEVAGTGPSTSVAAPPTPVGEIPPSLEAAPEVGGAAEVAPAEPTVGAAPAEVQTAGAAVRQSTGPGGPVRRGLPRSPGGEPWPPAELAVAVTATAPPPAPAAAAVSTSDATTVTPAPPVTVTPPAMSDRSEPTARADAPAPAARPSAVPAPPEPERPATRSASPAPAASPAATSASATPRTFRGRPLSWWVVRGAGLAVAAVAAAGIVVLAARGVTTLPGVPQFLDRYPGEYHPAVETEEGFPAWARWTHYLNFFFLVLIVRTGLLVRQQQQPPAFVTPKRGGKKVSIYLWLHLSLDVLWLLNGIVFVTLLFLTGHWARIVPTSVEVFPNAASALLQYLTLEWPTENGWVNYNSLQQLMYFTIVFVAAPLAAITGVRMSEWWPKNRPALNRAYPVGLARAIHFPVMLFFVLFTIIHVFLVFATGALRNLNHMFAGQDTVSWAGFWWFTAGLAVSVAAVLAARPLVLAPLAGVTGKVSTR